MKMVYTHQNSMMVELAKNLLSENGIEAKTQNEFASGGSGELSAIDSWPELWVVDDIDYQVARNLIEDVENRPDIEEWVCGSCNESNDVSFEVCWSCQSSKP